MAECLEGYTSFYFPVETGDGADVFGSSDYTKLLCLNVTKMEEAGIGNFIPATDGSVAGSPDWTGDMDQMWVFIAACLVFFMQGGFAMLEAGSVSSKNTINILFKNLLDVSIGAVMFWLFGYAIAYGVTDEPNSFIGVTDFALSNTGPANDWISFFFQFAFAATASTIVSGSVAERTKFSAYFIYSIFITGIIYPVVVYWVWSGAGWLTEQGFTDFAGSGVVHMVGGFAGLVGAFVVGPRAGRFTEDGPVDKPGHSVVLSMLGVIILWFGWYGFNAGSTLAAYLQMELAGKVAANTTIAAAAACVTTTLVVFMWKGYFDLPISMNSIIAGLVSITAGCANLDPWGAFLAGMFGALVYLGSDLLLVKLKIDDPLAAAPLHGFCGIWGCLAAGFFDVTGSASIPAQFIGAFAILGWTLGTSLVVFYGIKFTIGMRVDEETESEGLDSSEHGGAAYYGFDDESYETSAVVAKVESEKDEESANTEEEEEPEKAEEE